VAKQATTHAESRPVAPWPDAILAFTEPPLFAQLPLAGPLPMPGIARLWRIWMAAQTTVGCGYGGSRGLLALPNTVVAEVDDDGET